MTDTADADERALHLSIAATMGRGCALRRAEYYDRAASASREQARRLERVASVYGARARAAEHDGEECEE